ncbi:amino acid permease, partial [archaeon]
MYDFYCIGLKDGLWSFFLATVVVGIGFICLTFSFAEMVSMLPFTGGCYGYVRCSLGPWWGYMVGCCEATKYIVFHAIMVQQVAKIVYMSLDISSDWAPLIWLGTMAIIVPVQVHGKKMF